MLAEERHREILTHLADTGSVRVAELARVLGVTEETIRRDLDKLAHAGLLVRTHGGAMPMVDRSQDAPFAARQTANRTAKERIARHALRHVDAGDVIALDASSTVHELACALPDVSLTVVTNALPAAATLMARPNIRVICTGGILDAPTRSWIGSFAEDALERLNINKLFLSSKGVDLERGLSEVDDAQARVKRRMMSLAEKVYLLVDQSKFDQRSTVFLAQLRDVDTLITDAPLDSDVANRIADLGVLVEVAE